MPDAPSVLSKTAFGTESRSDYSSSEYRILVVVSMLRQMAWTDWEGEWLADSLRVGKPSNTRSLPAAWSSIKDRHRRTRQESCMFPRKISVVAGEK